MPPADGAIDDPQERLDETRAWMLQALLRFKEVVDPRVQDILRGLSVMEDGTNQR